MNVRRTMTVARRLCVGLAGFTGALVAQPAPPVLPSRSTDRDVVVLQHRADAFARAPRWSLAKAPIATADGAQAPEFDLTYAFDVEILSDGRLVALAPIGNHLLVFSPTGVGEKSLGKQGKGPGEIMGPNGMSRANGDTLVIPDGANNRINWLVATKGFVANKPLPRIPGSSFIHPVGALRNGALVMSTAGLMQHDTAPGISRPPSSVVVLSRDAAKGTVVATIPDLELTRVETRYRGRRNTTSTALEFSRGATVRAWDTVIATGSGDGYRIDLRDSAGRMHTSIRVPLTRRVVTKSMRDSVIAMSLQRLAAPAREGMVDPAESRRLAETAPFADSLPPYGQWFVTPNRTLWVLDARAPGDVTRSATAFRQNGAIVARLTWSIPGDAIAFGDDRLVLRQTDADGVVSLVVYRILPSGR